jgi:hypothetical protein
LHLLSVAYKNYQGEVLNIRLHYRFGEVRKIEKAWI